MRRLPRSLRQLGSLALALFVLWLGALGWFVATGLLLRADPSIPTDAIVVLTGGRQRLETGIQLLVAGAAKTLFISGVNQRVDRNELLRVLGPAAERETCCIVVGHEAANTFENARETAGWMRDNGYTTLRLVTGWYHMRRSRLEFERAMPGIAIVAHPVFAPHLDPERWWSWHGAPLLILGEYHKYLAAWLRPVLSLVAPSLANAVDRRR